MTTATSDGSGADVRVLSDTDTMAAEAAAEAARVLRDAAAVDGVAHAMFATGNSQLAFVDALVEPSAGVPWGDVVVFHMDEYVGIGPDHPASFQRWIRNASSSGSTPRRPTTSTARPTRPMSAPLCRALLAAHPLDLCCLGIGENGHLAFNDPGVADFEDPLDVKVVELDAGLSADSRWARAISPPTPTVPRRAMTVTVPALLRARPGAGRRARGPEGGSGRCCPHWGRCRPCVSGVGPATHCPRATVFLDAESAALLPGWR